MSGCFLQALHCQNEGRPPVWLMRQAGRYLPEYQKLRQKNSLWEMFHNPQIAAEVTLLPIDILHVDAAILFSDILVIAEAFGHRMVFPESGGPRIEPPVRTSEDVKKLQMGDIKERLSHVFETIRLLKPALPVPLIGFCGGPFTIASYMIEGGGKSDLPQTRAWLQSDPETFHELLEKITRASIAYLKMQVEAGVQAVQIFDSWANLLDDAAFSAFSVHYLKRMVDALKETHAPIILFCRGSSLRPEMLVHALPQAISFDWHREMKDLRQHVPPSIAIQGNLDPEILRQNRTDVIKATQKILEDMRGEKGFIANLGHGVLPDVPVENVRAFVDTVRFFATSSPS